MQKGEDKMETRLIEVDKAQYVKESGNFVLDATHLTENKRRRKAGHIPAERGGGM